MVRIRRPKTFKKQIKIDGEVYRHNSWWATKTKAESEATLMRKSTSGLYYKARVRVIPNAGGYSLYVTIH